MDRRIGGRDDRRGIVPPERRVAAGRERAFLGHELELVPGAREVVDAPEDLHHVLVAGHDPCPPGGAPVDRILVAQPPVDGIWVPDEVVRAEEPVEPIGPAGRLSHG